jgi:hypothetical protein
MISGKNPAHILLLLGTLASLNPACLSAQHEKQLPLPISEPLRVTTILVRLCFSTSKYLGTYRVFLERISSTK